MSRSNHDPSCLLGEPITPSANAPHANDNRDRRCAFTLATSVPDPQRRRYNKGWRASHKRLSDGTKLSLRSRLSVTIVNKEGQTLDRFREEFRSQTWWLESTPNRSAPGGGEGRGWKMDCHLQQRSGRRRSL